MTHSTEHKHDSPRTPRATYQDVLDAHEHRVAEIVDGTLHVSPRPPTLAALAKTRLSAGVGRAFARGRDGPGGWWIFHEPELHFGEDVLVPDVTGWRRERMPKLPDTDYVILAPDWACEVLSPATRRLDLVDKRPVYGPCVREERPTDISQCCEAGRMTLGYLCVCASGTGHPALQIAEPDRRWRE